MKKIIQPLSGRKPRLLLKAAVSSGLLIWLLTRIDTGRLLVILADMPTAIFLGALLLYLIATATGALKWFLLATGYEYGLLFKLMFVAQYYALLLPGQIAGELVKAHKLIKYRADPQGIISALLFDRITGWSALAMLGLVGLLGTKSTGPAALKTNFAVVFGALLLLVLLLKSELPQKLLQRLVDRRHERANIAARMGRTLAETLAMCRAYTQKPAVLSLATCLGLVFHLLGAALFFLLAGGLGIDVAFFDWCWVFAALSLILLLPLAVGGIGLREGGLVIMLGWLSVPAEKALAVSLSFFALQVLAALIGAVLEWHPYRKRCRTHTAPCESD